MPRIFSRFLLLCICAAQLLACQPPPPAPEGLDAVTSYMVREFYSDDELYSAGLQGFMNWFNEEGFLLVGERATSDNTDAFTISTLDAEDVALLPLVHGRPVEDAKGVVSLAEMECTLAETEGYLVRADQDVVFASDWEGYERTFATPRSAYEAASESGEYAPIDEGLDPFAEGYDGSGHASTLMQTVNMADPSAVLFADLEPYQLFLDFRHGEYELDGEQLQVFAILSFQTDTVSGPGGDNHLHQTYGIEVNIERAGGKTLRMLAVWAEPEGGGLSPDDPLVLNYAVNKSLNASEDLSAICSGETEIPPES